MVRCAVDIVAFGNIKLLTIVNFYDKLTLRLTKQKPVDTSSELLKPNTGANPIYQFKPLADVK